MKVLAILLSIYVLMLTALPCKDAALNLSSVHMELSQQATDHSTCEGDHCSPFCTCNCCTSPIVFQGLIIDFCCYSTPQVQLTQHQTAAPNSIAFTIWQPPKIS